jgi:peroxiredoxin
MAVCPPLRSLCVAILFLSLLSPAKSFCAETKAPSRTSEQKQLGDLDLRTPAGEQVSLIPYITRKAIVVVFWAAWCPICRAEAPRVNQLNANPNVKVIAVNEGDSDRQIKTFIDDYKVGYQVVVDPVADLAKAFGVPGMPYCVILNRSGVVVYRGFKLPADLDYYIR